MPQQDQDSNAHLLADRRLIDEEHARLERFLRDLRDTCSEFESAENCRGCGREKAASCQGRLASFLHDFLDLVAEHFEHEEKLMQVSLSAAEHGEYIRRHRAAHEKLVREVTELMRKLSVLNQQGGTVLAIRQLYHKIMAMFGEHAREFDDSL